MNLLDYKLVASSIVVVFDCIANIYGANRCAGFWAGDGVTTVRSPSIFEYHFLLRHFGRQWELWFNIIVGFLCMQTFD